MRRPYWIIAGLALIALVVSGPSALHYAKLYYTAWTYSRVHRSSSAQAPKPGTLRLHIQPAKGAVVCDFGSLRMVLLDRTRDNAFGMSVPIAGKVPSRQRQLSVKGVEYFSHDYANGRTDCKVHDLPFFYLSGEVYVAGRSVSTDTPTLLMIDTNHEVVFVRAGG